MAIRRAQFSSTTPRVSHADSPSREHPRANRCLDRDKVERRAPEDGPDLTGQKSTGRVADRDVRPGRATKNAQAVLAAARVEPEIHPDTFDYEAHVCAVAALGVDMAALKRRLKNELGIEVPTAVEQLVGALQRGYPKRPIIAELWTELSILAFVEGHFWDSQAFAVSPVLAARRGTTGGDAAYKLKTIFRDIEAIADTPDKALAAAGYGVADLFSGGKRLDDEDGNPVSEKLKIARWLGGPYGKIRTPDELRSVLLKDFGNLEFQREHSAPGHGLCVQVNPNAWSKLNEAGLYSVLYAKMAANSAFDIDHEFIIYFPPGVQRAIVIDYSFNQFVSRLMTDGPAVAYLDEIDELLKAHGGSGAHFFAGAPRAQWSQGIDCDVVDEIVRKLST